MKLLYVEWADAMGPESNGWIRPESVSDEEQRILTVGWLWSESKTAIKLVGMYCPAHGEDTLVAHVVTIPKSQIRRKRILKP